MGVSTKSDIPASTKPAHRVTGWLNTGLRWIDRLFGFLAIIALLAIAAVVTLQVVARFTLPSSPVWTEELSRYLFIYLIVLSSGLVIRQNRQVRLELFQHALSPRYQAVYQALCHLLTGAFAAYILPSAWKYAMIGRWQTSPALEVPMVWVFLSMVVFFALTVVYSTLGAISAFSDLRRSGVR
ncbi:C4-dicarboxylate ABC transporter permease [Marinobacterium aestuarii]|uniref:TRAP transporter small permease protein n=1 Tax=Marinobacterium aestuarii TaxID=1821621 RepID=A0A1A9EZ62_9GAMM|nr:TRAP transporter small permease [Marinobacterium aestuarii]ANG63177.1 C4-dicarboxylate ABC transporter permease [Marinobacterium aestuarii]